MGSFGTHIIVNARHLVITAPVPHDMEFWNVSVTPDVESRSLDIQTESFAGMSRAMGAAYPEDSTSRSAVEMFLIPTAWGL